MGFIGVGEVVGRHEAGLAADVRLRPDPAQTPWSRDRIIFGSLVFVLQVRALQLPVTGDTPQATTKTNDRHGARRAVQARKVRPTA